MLLGTITAHALAHPDKTAFIHNGTACSYGEFAQRLSQAVYFFRSFGLAEAGQAPGGLAWFALTTCRRPGL